MPKQMSQVAVYLLLIAPTLTACATTAPGQSYRLSNNGYATVLYAPHSKLSKQDLEQIEKIKKSIKISSSTEDNQFRYEAKQLEATLMEKEPDNFTEFRHVWEPEFHYLFSFKRDPQNTLAKYTSNPAFKSGTQRHTRSYLEAKRNKISKVLASVDTYTSSQINMEKGVLEIPIGSYEDDFFLIPEVEKYRDDPDIEFAFPKRRSPEEIIDPRLATHIKLFLRDDKVVGDEIVIGSTTATIQLRDGCFFTKENKSLILFPESSNLGLDEDGYIIIYNDLGYISRVGERMRFWNGFRAVEDAKYTEPLQDACGQFPVVKINDPKSEYVSNKTDDLY